MDITLPPQITKKIANQARMNVASYFNYFYEDKPTDDVAMIVCYESIVHDLLDKFRAPYDTDRPYSNREEELFKLLKKRYGNDVSYESWNQYSSDNGIWVQLGLGAMIGFHWNDYQHCFDTRFKSRGIYSIYISSEDLDKIVETIDFVRENISLWQPLAAECIRDYRKKQKVLEIKQTAVKSFATQKLNVCGIPYRLEQGKLRDKVYFKISPKDMAMFYLSHKNFDTAIDKIIAAAKQIKELMEEIGLQLQVKKITDNMYFQNDNNL